MRRRRRGRLIVMRAEHDVVRCLDGEGPLKHFYGAGNVWIGPRPARQTPDGQTLSKPAGTMGALVGGAGAFGARPNARLADELALSAKASSSCLTCTRAGIDDDVKRRVAGCIRTADYNKLPVSFASAGAMYTNHGGSVGSSVLSYVASAAGSLVQTSDRWNAWVVSLVGVENDANTFMHQIMTEMSAKFAAAEAAGQPFQNYQKVCMAQCVASQIIRYASDFLSKFGGASAAVAEGVGVCTEFSAIAQRVIANTAGPAVSSWVGYSNSANPSLSHAFVQVAFDGYTYSIEPQQDPRKECTCTFYR